MSVTLPPSLCEIEGVGRALPSLNNHTYDIGNPANYESLALPARNVVGEALTLTIPEKLDRSDSSPPGCPTHLVPRQCGRSIRAVTMAATFTELRDKARLVFQTDPGDDASEQQPDRLDEIAQYCPQLSFRDVGNSVS